MRYLSLPVLGLMSVQLYGLPMELSLEDAIAKTLANNYSIKLLDLQIKQIHLDIEQEFIDLKDTDLKQKRKAIKILQLHYERQDTINYAYYKVYKSYFQAVLSAQKTNIAQQDLTLYESYLKDTEKQYQQGKIDHDSYKSIQHIHKEKEESLIVSQGEYTRSILALLIYIGEDLDTELSLTTKVSENTDLINIKQDIKRLEELNRNIRLAKQTVDLRTLEYQLLDKQFTSSNEFKRSEFEKHKAEVFYKKTLEEQKQNLMNDYLSMQDQEASKNKAQDSVQAAQSVYTTQSSRYQKGYIHQFKKDQAHIILEKSKLMYQESIVNLNLSKFIYSFNFI